MTTRRELLLALGAGALTMPFGSRAQQAMPVVGVLSNASSAQFADYVSGFRRGLRQFGYVEGQNIRIEFRWADGRYEQLTALAEDLSRHRPAVIFTTGVPGVRAAKAASPSVPVVFTYGDDPVAAGLVSSMNRPDGNMTGISHLIHLLGAKRLELLSELVPNARVIAAIENSNNFSAKSRIKEIQDAAKARGHEVYVLDVKTDTAIEPAFAEIAKRRADGLVVSSDGLFTSHRKRLIELAARQSIPAVYGWREFPVGGGLMSYGANLVDQYRLAGIYTGRILKGDKPSDLPILQPTKIELVINLKTAKALGLTVPPTLLVRAEEIIE